MNLIKSIGFTLAISAIFATVACNNNANKTEKENPIETEDEAIETAFDPNDGKLPFEIKDNVIFNENVPVVVDFYADWCQPCKQYAPIFQTIAEKNENTACFIKINIDEYPDLAKSYNVEKIPTTVFILPGGGVLGAELGALTEETLQMYVDQLTETAAGNAMEI